jgi:hypothetical protein
MNDAASPSASGGSSNNATSGILTDLIRRFSAATTDSAPNLPSIEIQRRIPVSGGEEGNTNNLRAHRLFSLSRSPAFYKKKPFCGADLMYVTNP